MIDVIHWAVLAVAVVIGYLLYRYYLRVDVPRFPVSPSYKETFPDRAAYEACLAKYGVKGDPFQIPERLLPLHPSVVAVLGTYGAIRFDPSVDAVARQDLFEDYENPEFVRFGMNAEKGTFYFSVAMRLDCG